VALTYRLDLGSDVIAQHFAADMGRDAWQGGALAPGQFAPVIVRTGRQASRLVRPMHWGYPAPGQSTEFAGVDPIRWVPTMRNVKSPFWIGNLRHRELRCLVPATSFALGGGKARRWYRFADQAIAAFAGIWRDLTDMPVFAILCIDPPSGFSATSMPLVLTQATAETWLGADWSEAKALVRPTSASLIEPLDG
jgi:putative SOS response-associated peptidase YedK